MKCLFYIAGDVSNYSTINYELNGQTQNTFFAAHALYNLFKPDKVIALLPDSLVKDNVSDEECYKNLVINRAKELNFAGMEEFMNKVEIRKIPNVGIASAIQCENGAPKKEKNKEGREVLKRLPYNEKRSPIFIFNAIYAIFKDEACDEYLVDLTHGTNVLVSIVMNVGALFNAKFYSAPVMGMPGKDSIVNIVELTDVVQATNDSLMIRSSIENLDERYFKDYSNKLKKLNPNTFEEEEKKVLNRVKGTDVNLVINFLWNIRNGFTVNVVKSMNDLKNIINQLEEDLEKLKSFYKNWEEHKDFQGETLLVLSDLDSTLKVKDLLIEGNDLEKLNYLLDLYIEASIYDKALSLARELPVAICLSKVEGGTFDDKDEKYKYCNEIVTSYLRLRYSDLVELRNTLMHGGLSTDMKPKVDDKGNITPGKTVTKNKIEDFVKRELRKDFDKIVNFLSSA
ncbi:MAG: CRISPR-associated protein [Acidianus sp.]|nr:CRISPR-associated protein [Acidianus sp.]